MKINLYCDVLLVPPAVLVKEGRDRPCIERFLKTISLPALLVPGQTYQMNNDPVTGNPDPSDFVVVDSGVFEEGSKQTPYMVIRDDFWLAFEPWLEHEADVDERALPFDEQVALWRKEDEKELEQVKWRFEQRGWKICSSGEREPTRSRPTFKY